MSTWQLHHLRPFDLRACLVLLAISVVCGASTGCKTPEENEKSTSPAEEADRQKADNSDDGADSEDDELAAPDDSGPLLDRDRTPLEVVDADPVDLEPAEAARHDDALFLRVPIPEQHFDSETVYGPPNFQWLDVQAERHGIVAYNGTDDASQFLIRLEGTERPSKLAVRTTRMVRPRGGGEHLSRRTWHVDLPDKFVDRESNPDSAPLPERTRAAVASRFENIGPWLFARPGSDQFYPYAAAVLRGDTTFTDSDSGASPGNWLGDAIGAMSGHQAIAETLQADRQLRIPDEADTDPVSLDSIEGVDLPELPWDELLDALPEGADGSIEPVAGLVPDDRIYARYSSLRDFIELTEDAGTALAPMFGSRADSEDVAGALDQYETQLGLERSEFAKQFGDLAVEEVAVLLDSPYLPSGTAATIVFRTNMPDRVGTFLDGQLQHARSEFDATESTFSVAGHEVRRIQTDDRRLSHVRLTLDNAVVVSNSRAPVEAIVDVVEGQRRSLADSPGFEFMRRQYDAEADRIGFLYIGDRFVERFTGPAYRIGQSRRQRAWADLAALHYGPMVHAWYRGRWPDAPDSMVDSRYLPPDPLEHGDGTPIAYDFDRGASSDWGRFDWMRPVSELDVSEVSHAERDAYRDFRNDYENRGRRFIDPIAVAFDRGEQSVQFDIRVTPLHEDSDYLELADVLGDARLQPAPTARGLQIGFAIGEDTEFRRSTQLQARRFLPGDDITLDWLGDWGAIGLADRSGIWDAAVLLNLVPTHGDPDTRFDDRARRRIEVFNRLPFWLSFEVDSPMGLATFLSGIREASQQFVPNGVEWTSAEPYGDIDIKRVDIDLFSGETPLRLFYTQTDGAFVASVERETLEYRIDALQQGYFPHPDHTDEDAAQASDQSGRDAGGDAQIAATFQTPADSWLTRTALGLVEASHAYRLRTIAARQLAAQRTWPELDGQELDRKARRWADLHLGNPHGRPLQIDDNGAVVDPLYGILRVDRTQPGHWLHKLPEIPVTPSPITEWLAPLHRAHFEMELERHGDARGLHVNFEFEWREE